MTAIPFRHWALGLTAALSLASPTVAQAEAAIALTTSTGSTLIVASSVMKSIPAAKDEGWLAYDLAVDQVMLADPQGKRVIKGSFAAYCQAIHTLLTGAVKAVPPPRPLVVVTPVGDGGKIAGVATAKYRVEVNGRPYQEVWVAVSMPASVALASWASVKLATCSSLGGSEAAPELDPRYRAMAERGLIVQTVSSTGGKGEIRDTITDIRDSTLSPADLSPPAAWPVVSFDDFVNGR